LPSYGYEATLVAPPGGDGVKTLAQRTMSTQPAGRSGNGDSGALQPVRARPPKAAPTIVRRDLVHRLAAARHVRVVTLIAPTGFGKTTLLSQWAASDPRPFLWVSCDASVIHPRALLSRVGAALESLPRPAPRPSPWPAGDSLARPTSKVVVGPPRQFVLVLDNLETVDTEPVGAALRALVDQVPMGSALVLASRREPVRGMGLARLELACQLMRLGAQDLSFESPEVSQVLSASDVRPSSRRVRALMEFTGGWPAAVSVAARHLGKQGAEDDEDFFDDETRVVHQYVRDELIAQLRDEVREFLTACSILDDLSGPSCDAVTGWDGSRELLEQLERENLVVGPTDPAMRYRMLPLLRDVLRRELSFDPTVEAQLHGRASRWFEANADVGRAIHHARLAHDGARTELLFWKMRSSLLEPREEIVLGEWLSEIPEEELLRSPHLAVLAAWSALLHGDHQRCERRTTAAEHLLETNRFPADPSVHAALMLLRAEQARDVPNMLWNASSAYRHDPCSPLHSVACLLTGTALRLLDRPEQARTRLEEGLRVAITTAPSVETLCRVQLALIELEEDASRDAARQVQYALHLAEEQQLAEQPDQAEVFAIAALIDARSGATRQAQWEVEWARGLLEHLDELVPWIAIEARVVMAEASIHLGRIGQASEVLDEARSLTREYVGFGSLSFRIAATQRRLNDVELPVGVIATPLTPAELRVLRHLPTHLTYAEIAERLFVSRNTVKTQAIATYRKLGVSSRREAVECARSIGLLQ
jgi:LuxR family transcriptional regulator, maltose regulon positive regulatory protein